LPTDPDDNPKASAQRNYTDPNSQVPDAEHLKLMLESIKANIGALAEKITKDKGFCSEAKKDGKEIYGQRKASLEAVFGQMKEARGLRRFVLSGLEKVNGECRRWASGITSSGW